ncbi:hypothetical protein O988_00945 [Pseudogymnoascus sp. VKM F-3808]|nr:hypothetical protein O988_00945 [Pseudogymnoascus sp. VKM F-3808]
MRKGTKVFIFVNFVVICLLVNAFSTLIALLFEDGAVHAIPAADIMRPSEDNTDRNKRQVIPRIIHQTYVNDSIPAQWVPSQRSCIDLHPDYEYMLWTDTLSREFISKEYSWFLDTFDSYPFPIQRADAIRYFILDHYGGIYLDLDDGCARRLDVMLEYPAWLRRTLPTGISNDAMGAIPHHPFFQRVIQSLERYANNYGMPYITVMSSTGPLFLSIIWKQYMSEERPDQDQVRVLMPPEYRNNAWSIFYIAKGNSWHGKDAQTIFWMGKHWMLLTFSGFAVAGVVFVVMFYAWTAWIGTGRRDKNAVWGADGRRASGTPCHNVCLQPRIALPRPQIQKHQTRAAVKGKTTSPLPRMLCWGIFASAWFGNCAHWRSTERGLSADRIVHTYIDWPRQHVIPSLLRHFVTSTDWSRDIHVIHISCPRKPPCTKLQHQRASHDSVTPTPPPQATRPQKSTLMTS